MSGNDCCARATLLGLLRRGARHALGVLCGGAPGPVRWQMERAELWEEPGLVSAGRYWQGRVGGGRRWASFGALLRALGHRQSRLSGAWIWGD